MRFPFLALLLAAGALPSALLHGQNPAQAHAFEPLSTGESATMRLSDSDHAQSALFSAFNTTPPAARAAAGRVPSTTVDIDWRAKGAVVPVEEQGQCGSDWAFSAKGVLEGSSFVATGKLIFLSAQQLLDCDKSYGAMACNGGLPIDGLHYYEKNGAVANSAYPYTARPGTCRLGSMVAVVKPLKSIDTSAPGDDEALLTLLENRGPVAVRVEDNWVTGYTGAIHSCDSRQHSYISALLVGAITHNGVPVWVLKFAYGTKWGSSGYAYISRLRPNECGISDDVVAGVS